MPQIVVEFYGIPQARIGCQKLSLVADTIGDVLTSLAHSSPSFGKSCLSNGQLRPEFLMSINGKEFTRDPTYPLQEQDSVLILNADVGG